MRSGIVGLDDVVAGAFGVEVGTCSSVVAFACAFAVEEGRDSSVAVAAVVVAAVAYFVNLKAARKASFVALGVVAFVAK